MVRDKFLSCFIAVLLLFIVTCSAVSTTPPQPPVRSIKRKDIPNVFGRLSESVLLECGQQEHELLKQIESSDSSMPVLVNWYKHYSLTRRNEKPIYAKYLANNIDYEPHISRDYESRLQVVDKINLNISSLRAVDEALYECRLILFDKAYAESQTGYMAYLQVHVAPEFEYPNEEIVYFKPNMPIRLYCYAKGKPIPSITWYKNGIKLDANTSVLQETFYSYDDENSLLAGPTADIYEYKCRAENLVGRIEHTVKVIRSGSLFFTEPVKNLTVTEGTILNWPCLAQSNTEITYKWFKDSVAVQSHLHRWSERGALFQDGMLYLLETYRNDSGWYECHAYTANKRIETTAYLNVLYGPDIVPFQSPFYTIESSASVVIDCVVKSNPSIMALEWFKDKYLLSNSGKYQILPNNSLLIRNVEKSDAGQYYCTCNNTLKKVASPIIQVEVIDSKQQALDLTSIMTSTSQNQTRLACKTAISMARWLGLNDPADLGLDETDFTWYKLNSRLSNRHVIESNGSLLITGLRFTDSGIYLCKLNERSPRLINKIDPNRMQPPNEKFVKLIVIQNNSMPDWDVTSGESTTRYEVIELPLCPTDVVINQTNNGIRVSWTYPKQSPVKIEYFQVYFRQVNEKQSNNEWKTTESISSTETSYLIDESELVENHLYEFQLVSFSIYSKSLPTSTQRFKYLPKISKLSRRPNVHAEPTTVLKPSFMSTAPHLVYNYLLNITQLDIILIVIFLILMFILIICIAAFIAYKRSYKSLKTKSNSKNGDMDDWGFQSSSIATGTYLSSPSSSEKSTSVENSQTIKPDHRLNSPIDHDLKISDRSNEPPTNPSILIANQNYTLTRSRILNSSLNRRGGGVPNAIYSDQVFNTIVRNKVPFRNVPTGQKSSGYGYFDSSSSHSSSINNQISSSASGCQQVPGGPGLVVSSGIASANSTVLMSSEEASCSPTSSTTNEDEKCFKVNMIKYNAKTNKILQDANRLGNNRVVTEDEDEDFEDDDNGYNSNEMSLLNNSSKDDELNSNNKRKVTRHCYNWLSKQQENTDDSKRVVTKLLVKSSDENGREEERVLLPPFPTSHFNLKSSPNVLNSGSSLTLVSKMPSTSHCYIGSAQLDEKDHQVNNSDSMIDSDRRAANTFSTVSSTSSGCSSLEINSKTIGNKEDLIQPTKQSYSYRSSDFKSSTSATSNNNNNTSTFRPSRIDFV